MKLTDYEFKWAGFTCMVQMFSYTSCICTWNVHAFIVNAV
jgi:hypothetical protein